MTDEELAFKAEFGFSFPSRAEFRVELPRFTQSLRDWQRQFLSDGRVALLDNALLRRVAGLLGYHPDEDPREACSAEGLAALNTWLTAIVFYDRIAHLENPEVPPSAWMSDSPVSDAFVEIGCDLHRDRSEALYPGLFEFLDRIHGVAVPTVSELISTPGIREAIWGAWSALVGTNKDGTRLFWEKGPTIDDIFVDDYQNRWPTPANEITRLLTSPEDSDIEADIVDYPLSDEPLTLASVLTDSALRTVTNRHIATIAGVTYLPSPVRVPVLAALGKTAEQWWRETEWSVLKQIRSRTEQLPSSQPVLERVEYSLPPLLAVALYGVKTRDQLLERVGKLRSMAGRCRRVIEEYEIALRERDSADPDKAVDHYNQMWEEAEAALKSLRSTMFEQLFGAAVPAALGAAAALGMFLFPSLSFLGGAFTVGAAFTVILEYFRDKGIEVTGLFGQGRVKQLVRRPGLFLAHMVDIDGKGLIVPPESLTTIWDLDTQEAARASQHLQAFSETIARLDRASA
jgi:hypothetical protein